MDRKFVRENRAANTDEINAIKRALDEFGVKDVCSDFAFLFGRYDAPYGWYLFKLNVNNDHQGKFMILGDCLDVLPDYGRMLTLKDVHEFAIGESDGRYEAMQTWGVFKSLSQGFCAMMDSIDVCIENERAHWDDKRKEWKLSYDVMFDTDMGGNEKVTITIPAQLGNSDEADREFMSGWKGECAAYLPGERYEDFIDDCEVTAAEAMRWAESKEDAMYAILKAMRNYLENWTTPAEGEERVAQNRVWVLIIYKDEQNFAEVHKTFDGAVESAIADIQKHMDEEDVDEYDYVGIKKALEEEMYWKDENTDTVYDVCECPLCK